MMPYPPINGPPPKVDRTLEQIADYPSPSPLLSPRLPPQLHISPPTEEQFMNDFILFSDATGVRLSEDDFLIEGRLVNPWEMHSIVSARNGFDSVTVKGEWSMVGVELGFPRVTWEYPGSDQWAHCSPSVAHQLQQLYQDTLRLFDHAYSCGMIDQLRNSQAPVQVQVPSQPPQSPAQPLAYQRTDADYQAPLAGVTNTPQSSTVTFQEDTTVHSSLQFLQSHQQQEQEQQLQQRRAYEESMHGSVMNFSSPQQQFIFASQRNWMPQRVLERPSMTQASSVSPFQEQSIPQQLPLGFVAGGLPSGQGQQQQSDFGLGSLIDQNLDPPGMRLPQGPGSPQQNLIQLSPSLPHANARSSTAPSAPGAQQVPGHGNLSAMSIPQLRALYNQLLQIVTESDKNLSAAGSSGESDVQRQLRLKVENNKRYLRVLREIISAKMRESGDPTQPLDGALPQTNGAQPPKSPLNITLSPLQQPPSLSEDQFKSYFRQFTASKGMRLSERDFVIDGRLINLYALHRVVFLRNGFENVSAHDEWPVIGAALGFPRVTDGVAGRPPRCGPAVAHRLQRLYNDVLREFDEGYISDITARSRSSQESGKLPLQPPQPQVLPHQPTEADYQALLGSITSKSSAMNSEAMSILPRFAYATGADLEARHVPPYIIAFVEQNREHLQRAARDQIRFRASLTSVKSEALDSPTRANHVSPLQTMAPQQLQRPSLFRGSGKPSTLQPAQVFVTDRPFFPLSTGGSMSVSVNPTAMNGVTSGNQSAIRRPTSEELINAKRLVDGKKRMAFSRASGFDWATSLHPIPECDIQEYHRNVERLDSVLVNIEKYIYYAFAVLKKEEIVERMFTMMASVKIQIEELKKPNPRYVLELHTIRGMIQEVDNMDKGLRAVLQRYQAHTMPPGGVPSALQPPPVVTTAQFAPPANPDLRQGDESAFYRDGRLEDVKIAMSKLEIR